MRAAFVTATKAYIKAHTHTENSGGERERLSEIAIIIYSSGQLNETKRNEMKKQVLKKCKHRTDKTK